MTLCLELTNETNDNKDKKTEIKEKKIIFVPDEDVNFDIYEKFDSKKKNQNTELKDSIIKEMDKMRIQVGIDAYRHPKHNR